MIVLAIITTTLLEAAKGLVFWPIVIGMACVVCRIQHGDWRVGSALLDRLKDRFRSSPKPVRRDLER